MAQPARAMQRAAAAAPAQVVRAAVLLRMVVMRASVVVWMVVLRAAVVQVAVARTVAATAGVVERMAGGVEVTESKRFAASPAGTCSGRSAEIDGGVALG